LVRLLTINGNYTPLIISCLVYGGPKLPNYPSD